MLIWPRDDASGTEAGRYRASPVEISCLASGDLVFDSWHGTTGLRRTDTGRETAPDAWLRASPLRSFLPGFIETGSSGLALCLFGGDISRAGCRNRLALRPYPLAAHEAHDAATGRRVSRAAQGCMFPRRAKSAAMSRIPDLDEQGAVGRPAGAFRGAAPGIIPCRRDAPAHRRRREPGTSRADPR